MYAKVLILAILDMYSLIPNEYQQVLTYLMLSQVFILIL
jgi:hypothetical protein